MSDSNEKGNPPPVPQAAPYEVRFALALRPETNTSIAAADDKDAPPAPQGAPATDLIATNGKG
jgi:hypothetical protein